ncbi:hypothetical protein CANMA_004391 [Candida margitis]|uniref:uncharacterized protein n=1 Tax=Candida margitis TaxID=1775924 RepID=UPI002226A7C2|nr:uncharacterized protein CANMA_004391 [Candida margitis]KAI5957387.1 hypothetical protein CANMA_004391 [Candida margitis]
MSNKSFGALPLEVVNKIIHYAGVENLVSFLVPENKTIIDNLPLLKQAIDNAICENKALGYNNRVTRPSYLHNYLHLPRNSLREVDLSTNDKNEPLRIEVLDLTNKNKLREENTKLPPNLKIFEGPWEQDTGRNID